MQPWDPWIQNELFLEKAIMEHSIMEHDSNIPSFPSLGPSCCPFSVLSSGVFCASQPQKIKFQDISPICLHIYSMD